MHLHGDDQEVSIRRIIKHTKISSHFLDDAAKEIGKLHNIVGVTSFKTAGDEVQKDTFVFALAEILNFEASSDSLDFLLLEVEMAHVANLLRLCFSVKALRQYFQDYLVNHPLPNSTLFPSGDPVEAKEWALSTEITLWMFHVAPEREPED